MLSIIIPVLNEHEMTKECISSVIKNTANPFEIILIDNGSIPPYSEKVVCGYEIVIRNEKNMGFPCAVNQGIRSAKGGIICLLNNDVVLTPGWSERLLDGLNRFSIVGPMTNYCAGVQSIQVPIYYDREGLNKRA